MENVAVILSIDPGIRGCGAALWTDLGSLCQAGYVVNDIKSGSDLEAIRYMAYAVDGWITGHGMITRLVFEWPQVYAGPQNKINANDLLTLAGVDAAIATRIPAAVAQYLPREWKGQLPKGEAFEARVKDRLGPEVANVTLPRGGLAHNVWDAIGIGLFFFGRFERKRVIAR